MAHAELHPDHVGADLDCFLGDRSGGLGIAEDIDHVDLEGNVLQGGIDRLPEDLLAGEAGVDRDDPVALALQVFRHEITRPGPFLAGPDHGDGVDGGEDILDVAVRISLVIDLLRRFVFGHVYSPVHSGARFSMKASIPSAASRACMLSTITWLV